jgi:hypothetical protein
VEDNYSRAAVSNIVEQALPNVVNQTRRK